MPPAAPRLTLLLLLTLFFTACAFLPNRPLPPVPTPTPPSAPSPTPSPRLIQPTPSPSPALLVTTPSAHLPAERIIARIPLGSPPTSIYAGPEGVWVLLYGPDTSTIVQIDPATNTLVGAPIPVGFNASEIVGGEGAIWVASNGQETIARIDLQTRQLTPIPVLPGNFIGVGAGAVWLANSGIRDTVQRIDPASGRVTSTFRVGPNPYGIAFEADSLWVPKHDDVTLSRIDPVTLEITAEISLPFAAHGIASGQGAVWVIDYHGQAIWPIDPATNRLGAPVNLPFLPTIAAIDQTGIWLPAYDENDTPITEDWITRLDPSTHRIVESLRVGEPVGPLALSDGSVWLCLQSGAVLRLRP